MKSYDINTELEGVAVIGMSGRFPGAGNVSQYWDNLVNGKCSVTRYTDEEMLGNGVPESMLDNPHYVKAGSHIEGIELFDAAFFGYTPREAECMDPQHRLFLECAWEAFESAGYNPEECKGLVGVFGGCGPGEYLTKNLVLNPDLSETVGDFQIMIGNSSDYFTSRVSYKFNLKGPSINIQTACSTSLVAICMGYQNLITYQCDMALCGGSSLQVPTRQGYMYQDGFIMSPDGLCRAFDEAANGTVQGDGTASVLLKRLDEAVRDRDHIHAVIRGVAVNNDGVVKMGFTAPSIDGQAQVIALAQELAGIDPDSITYVETHGTGTPLGDPIEIAALTKAFRVKTGRKTFCGIGSVKTNIGHLDAAAGVAGFIKTVLALENRQLPPSINFTSPNKKLNIEDTPFFVNTTLREWKPEDSSLRAGVSAFGIGGTNSHVILEEAPDVTESTVADRWKILLLSAKTENSLNDMKKNLANYLLQHNDANLSDVEYTLITGRRLFDKRLAVIARNPEDAKTALESDDARYIFQVNEPREQQPIVFMFTGQGSQFWGMTGGLYEDEPDFKVELDTCAEILMPYIGLDLRTIIYPAEDQIPLAEAELAKTEIVQPALFAVEYSLARYWMKRGVYPSAFIGHSLGEFVAACLAGVFTLEDALRIVAFRGKIIQSMPSGSMLSAPLSSEILNEYIGSELSIAAINGPELCVASGHSDAIKSLEKILNEKNINSSILRTSHAFHSPMVEPACAPFIEELKKIKLNPPVIPYISNVTGTWITPGEAVDTEYWGRHLRGTVNFYRGFETLINDGYRVFLEVGPDNTLCSISNRIVRSMKDSIETHIIPSLTNPITRTHDAESIAKATARLTVAGAKISWDIFYDRELRSRVPLPGYAFERKRYWIDPRSDVLITRAGASNRNVLSDEKYDTNAQHNTKDESGGSLEQRMIDVWSEVLGYKDLKLRDNFFDLGGDSLKAVQLIGLINKRFNQKLSLIDLFIDPTIDSMSKLVGRTYLQDKQPVKEEENTLRFPILFPIQPNGSKPPMFIVAGAHANRYFDPVNMKNSYEEDFLRYLSQIIPHIGTDQPVYGFRPKGMDASEKPHTSVEEMAAAYIEKIRLFQAKGPYLIAGECVGGIVAYEMARQLYESGEEVAHLILMDTYCPSKLNEYIEKYLILRRKAVSIIRSKIESLIKNGVRHFFSELKKDILLARIMVFPVTKRSRLQRQIMLRSYDYQCTLMKYRPVPYMGDITLIVNEEWHRNYPDMGWKENFRKKMTIIEVPGGHLTRLTTHGAVTGKHLSEVIKAVWSKYQ